VAARVARAERRGHPRCSSCCRRFATRYATVYDGVIGPWSLATFAEETGLATLHYVILLPSVDTCLERVLTRQGHGFTDEPATRKMHDEFSRASIAERHVLRNPPDAPDEVADEVGARVERGVLTYRP